MQPKLTRNEGGISSRRRTVASKTKSSRRAYVRIEAYRAQRGVRDREKEGERERNAFYRGEREAVRGMKSRERGRTREERVHGEMSRLSNGRRYRLVAGRPQFVHRGVFGGRSASLSFSLSFYLSLSLSLSRNGDFCQIDRGRESSLRRRRRHHRRRLVASSPI